MVLSLGNIAAAVAVVEEEEEVAKLLTEVSLSRATNKYKGIKTSSQDKNKYAQSKEQL